MGRSWTAGAIGVVTAVCTMSASGCGANASHASRQDLSTSYADYPVLSAGGASRIDVVSLAHARQVVNSKARPIWVAVKPEVAGATLPEVDSAREIRHEGALRVWVAKSDRGGLCLLLFDPLLSTHPATAHSVTASCGVAGELQRGISLVQHFGSLGTGASFLVGLVPTGVSHVSLSFGDGSSRLLPVADNAYSITVHQRIAGVSFVRGGVRQQAIP